MAVRRPSPLADSRRSGSDRRASPRQQRRRSTSHARRPRSPQPHSARHHDASISSSKHVRDRSPFDSHPRGPASDLRHQGGKPSRRSASPSSRFERHRRPSPDAHTVHHRQRLRESYPHAAARSSRARSPPRVGHSTDPRGPPPRRGRDSGHREREQDHVDPRARKHPATWEPSSHRDHRDSSKEFPDSRQAKRSPLRSTRLRSPTGRPRKVPSRENSRSRRSTPETNRTRLRREEERSHLHSRRPSRSPSRSGQASRRRSAERARERSREPVETKRARSRGRSRTPASESNQDAKMSWRQQYDHRGHSTSRGGWQSNDPRYSHSPHNQGYTGQHGAQTSYSPQQSPYPSQSGQGERGYFQGSPQYNSHQSSPHFQGSTPAQSSGPYSRGNGRGSQAPTSQRHDSKFLAPANPAGPGPHVRNLSWTPKTGTRGGHAPTVHGANVQTLESQAVAAAQAAEEKKSENPFRPASKELRVDDEAGKAGKGKEQGEGAGSPKTLDAGGVQIRFGLPKPGAAPAPTKPNPFQTKKNPFETFLNGSSAADERRDGRTFSSRRDERSQKEIERKKEEVPKRKGPKPALKHSVNRTFYDRKKTVHNVSWARLTQAHGDRELRPKLQRLRATAISKGFSLKALYWPALAQKAEDLELDEDEGFVTALENRCIMEEEAYRRHPKKRPVGQIPRLQDGETIDEVFKKEVVAIKYKIRRPQKILLEEYRNSNVYYRKPGNESVVGFGTYGKVFKAKHIYKGRDVALKRLRMEAEKDGFPITAMREMKILKHLEQRQAEGVIRLHELLYEVNFQNSVACFMVFEYMPHDLTGLLNHPSFKLTMAQKKDMARQTVEAIGFMHKQGVLHRDIKAANILVSHKGEIKLADFGLARFYDMDRQLHYTNRVVTIWYRAPELLYGQTEYGPAIDVWAAACVIVEIFTRHAIFPGNGKDLNQLLKVWEIMGFPTPEEWPGVSKTEWYFMMRPKEMMPNIFREKYSSGDLGAQTTPGLLDLLASMLQYDPDRRPTCDECLQHPFFVSEKPSPESVTSELETLGDWHEFESKKAKRAKEAEDRVDKDLKEGPPSCGGFVKDDRRDKGYRRDVMLLLANANQNGVGGREKRTANFSPVDSEVKRVKI